MQRHDSSLTHSVELIELMLGERQTDEPQNSNLSASRREVNFLLARMIGYPPSYEEVATSDTNDARTQAHSSPPPCYTDEEMAEDANNSPPSYESVTQGILTTCSCIDKDSLWLGTQQASQADLLQWKYLQRRHKTLVKILARRTEESHELLMANVDARRRCNFCWLKLCQMSLCQYNSASNKVSDWWLFLFLSYIASLLVGIFFVVAGFTSTDYEMAAVGVVLVIAGACLAIVCDLLRRFGCGWTKILTETASRGQISQENSDILLSMPYLPGYPDFTLPRKTEAPITLPLMRFAMAVIPRMNLQPDLLHLLLVGHL
ncbi:hypothetical protein OS493_015695 [Desmophyllum pertusum]|uniref:Transmembrane protein n=1 Tax=Desmophyllum pertusum TaxID=174260 RepID=A0A9W9YPE0_9CNID|nr:hypothetical protein OS493_015695 [Desmophyllum pertusum]